MALSAPPLGSEIVVAIVTVTVTVAIVTVAMAVAAAIVAVVSATESRSPAKPRSGKQENHMRERLISHMISSMNLPQAKKYGGSDCAVEYYELETR